MKITKNDHKMRSQKTITKFCDRLFDLILWSVKIGIIIFSTTSMFLAQKFALLQRNREEFIPRYDYFPRETEKRTKEKRVITGLVFKLVNLVLRVNRETEKSLSRAARYDYFPRETEKRTKEKRVITGLVLILCSGSIWSKCFLDLSCDNSSQYLGEYQDEYYFRSALRRFVRGLNWEGRSLAFKCVSQYDGLRLPSLHKSQRRTLSAIMNALKESSSASALIVDYRSFVVTFSAISTMKYVRYPTAKEKKAGWYSKEDERRFLRGMQLDAEVCWHVLLSTSLGNLKF